MAEQPTTRRNILLITTDQERYFANDPAPLPARERLRRLGTTYERFYGASAACSPARSVLYTGQHVPVTRMIDNVNMPMQTDLADDLVTLGHRLRDAGYHTAYKGKWHLSVSAAANSGTENLVDALEPYGFSDYSVRGDGLSGGAAYEGFELDDLIASEALEWLRAHGLRLRAEAKPWFLAVNLINPHDIMFAPFDTRYQESGARAMGRPFDGPPPSERYRQSWDMPLEASCHDRPDAPDRPDVHLGLALGDLIAAHDDRLRQFRDYYVNCIRDVDYAMERLLDGMDDIGLLDDTAIVFSADHGELAGAHGLFGKGPCAYDGNIRLPLIVVDPDVPGGTRTSAIASQVDIAPTILGLAAVPRNDHVRSGLPGRDLTSSFGAGVGQDGGRSSALFACSQLVSVDGPWVKDMVDSVRRGSAPSRQRDWDKRGLQRTVVTDRYKFSRYFSPGDFHTPASFEELRARNTLELFDLEADPEERTNLAFEPTAQSSELIEQLNKELQQLIDTEIGDDDARALPRIPGAPWMNGAE